jgi:hypothetical protein
MRSTSLLALLLGLGCSASTQPTPSAPSLTGTLSFAAGGSSQVTGSRGEWQPGTAQVVIMVWADSQPATDSLRPPLGSFIVGLSGAPFSSFPIAISVPVGTASGTSAARIWAYTQGAAYQADSGTVTVRPLSGGYAHLDLVFWCAPFRFQGSLEIPKARPLPTAMRSD